jgi:hypothetical protein
MKWSMASGIGAIVVWCSLFAAGVTIDSSPYRTALASGAAPWARTESGVAGEGVPASGGAAVATEAPPAGGTS